MCEDIAAKVEIGLVKGKTLATIESRCICKTKGKLETMNGPTCTWGCEFEADARDVLSISKLTVTCPVVDDSNLNIAAV
jgi:hypothetical protein